VTLRLANFLKLLIDPKCFSLSRFAKTTGKLTSLHPRIAFRGKKMDRGGKEIIDQISGEGKRIESESCMEERVTVTVRLIQHKSWLHAMDMKTNSSLTSLNNALLQNQPCCLLVKCWYISVCVLDTIDMSIDYNDCHNV